MSTTVAGRTAGATFRGTNTSLRDARGGFAGVGNAANGAAGGIGNAGNAAGSASSSFGDLGAALGTIGAVVGTVTVAFAALTAAAAAVIAPMARLVGVMDQAKFAFSALTGGAREGQAMLDETRELAVKMGLDVEGAIANMRRLLTMGFKQDTAKQILKMSGALKTLGASNEQINRVLLAMSQIKAQGKLMGDELLQLADAGVPVNEIYKQLGEQLGITTDEVMKLKEAGKITADQATTAIFAAVKAAAGGAETFDELIEGFAGTLTGKFGKMKASFQDFFLGLAADIAPALTDTLGPIFDEIKAFMTGAGAEGLKEDLASGFQAIGEIVAAAWPSIKAFLSGLAEGFKAAIPGIKLMAAAFLELLKTDGVTEAMRNFGRVLGFLIGLFATIAGVVSVVVGAFTWFAGNLVGGVISAVSAVVNWFQTLWATISDLAGRFFSAGGSIGNAIVEGILNALLGGLPVIVNAAKKLGSAAESGAKSELKSSSPSKVFWNIGRDSVIGLASGLTDNKNRAAEASRDMTGQSASAAVPAGSMAGSGGQNVINLNVDTAGAAAVAAQRYPDDPEKAATAFASAARGQLIDELETHLAMVGA
jgi:tape measure domain-containing protein